VQVAEQAAEQTLESRLGNLSLMVRGTMFTMGHFTENIVYIVMLSGSGEIDDILLEGGQILTAWYDEDEPWVYISGLIIHDWRNIDIDKNIAISEIYLEELDTFTLREILNNSEYLLENSEFVTEDILRQIPPILERRTARETSEPSTANRSYRDAQERWQVAQQNRRAVDAANNQARQNQNNNNVGNVAPPQPQPVATPQPPWWETPQPPPWWEVPPPPRCTVRIQIQNNNPTHNIRNSSTFIKLYQTKPRM